jgi:hypothetical protein
MNQPDSISSIFEMIAPGSAGIIGPMKGEGWMSCYTQALESTPSMPEEALMR